MKIKGYEFPKSSFLSLEKDLGFIVRKMLSNNNLKKLLYYTDKNCLSLPNLDEKQTLELIDKHIRIEPKQNVSKDAHSYIYMVFDDFVPNATNPSFRNNLIIFNIVCHYDDWNLGDFQLRPYKIAGEIDAMFNGKNEFGIGEFQLVGGEQTTINDEFGGVTLVYMVIHGNEDKKD